MFLIKFFKGGQNGIFVDLRTDNFHPVFRSDTDYTLDFSHKYADSAIGRNPRFAEKITNEKS